ncbi:MAG: GNAT family N-acetyltransferase [Sphingorhabdus sp.]
MTAAFDPAYGEAWTASQCLSILVLPDSQLYLAGCDKTMSGFALTRGVADEEELLLIATHPDHRERGIARQLVKAAVSNAQIKGRNRIFIEVRVNNPAIAFYRKIGFSEVGRRRGYYSGPNGHRFDAITMQMDI